MSLQFTVQYPDTIPDVWHISKEEFEKEAKLAMAVKLYEMKRISSGMAANLVGLNRVSFILHLHLYGVPVVDADDNELLTEVKNAY